MLSFCFKTKWGQGHIWQNTAWPWPSLESRRDEAADQGEGSDQRAAWTAQSSSRALAVSLWRLHSWKRHMNALFSQPSEYYHVYSINRDIFKFFIFFL